MLLADDLLREARPEDRPVVLSTVVSSPMLGSIAASHGARWEQTLTGHKWIQNRALDLADEGYTFVFGYEEALGYATSTAVRDKDGISAALRIADITARLKRRGKTLLDARDSLWRKHGVWIDRQVSIRFEGESAQRTMEAAVDRIRENPPRVIGGRAVAKMRDLKRQVEWTPSGGTPIADLAPSNVLIFELEGGHQAMLRPSGTEPKLKFYFYAVGSPAADKGLQSAKASARAVVERMAKDLTRATGC
jgi:phosphomannomutase